MRLGVGWFSAMLRFVLAIIVWYAVCKSLLSQLRFCLRLWAKRRNTLLGHKLVLRLIIVFLRFGGGSGAGSSMNSRCSGPLGRLPRRKGGAWALPPFLCQQPRCFSFFFLLWFLSGLGLLAGNGFWTLSWL